MHARVLRPRGRPGGPKYYPTFTVAEEAGAPEAGPEDSGTDATLHEAGAHEGGTMEGGGLEAGTPEGGSHDGGIHDAGTPDAEEEEGGVTYQDVLFCNCHGSIFNALDGTVIQGPAGTPLQILKTTVSGGVVAITIPKNS